MAINPDQTESQLWKLFDEILIEFWDGYFAYNPDISIKMHGKMLVPMLKVIPGWFKNNMELFNFLRNGRGKAVLKDVCCWNGRRNIENDINLQIPYKYRVNPNLLPVTPVPK
jgi:hypothetical protein